MPSSLIYNNQHYSKKKRNGKKWWRRQWWGWWWWQKMHVKWAVVEVSREKMLQLFSLATCMCVCIFCKHLYKLLPCSLNCHITVLHSHCNCSSLPGIFIGRSSFLSKVAKGVSFCCCCHLPLFCEIASLSSSSNYSLKLNLHYIL